MMGILERDGIEFRYEVAGDGPALVLCHGLGGDRQQPKELVGPVNGYRLSEFLNSLEPCWSLSYG